MKDRCVAVNIVCAFKSQLAGERCSESATEGHFCWVHARAVEAAAAKRREPVKVVPLAKREANK